MENEKEFNHGEQKMTSTLNLEGEAVRVSIGNGSFLHGDVQEVNAEQVKVRGRWFPLSAVQTEEEVEQFMKANIAEDRRRSRAEQEAKEAAEIALRGIPKIPVMLPIGGSFDAFVALLNSVGFLFDVRVREDGIETAKAQYRNRTGEELPEFAVYLHTNPDAWTAVEWRICATVPEGTVFPFETAIAGTLGRGRSVGSALLDGCHLTINVESIVGALAQSGLRVRKEQSWRS
jgi:hypothetical protein